MSLPFTDAFTNTTGTALTTHSGNYTYEEGTFEINSNAVRTTSTNSIARINSETFANDQYAQVSVDAIAATGNPRYMGAACRVATGAVTCYAFSFGGTATTSQRRLIKRVTGTTTELGSDTTAASVGKVFRVEAEGTTIRGKVDGSSIFSVTDSAIASGSGGIFGNGAASGHRADNLEAGNIAASVTATPTTATLTISTFAPTVQTPNVVTPTTLAITLSAFAPSVLLPVVATPSTLTLSLGTFAPTIQLPVVVTPAPLSLGLTTFEPTVALPVIVTPSALAISLATFSPTIISSTGGSGTTVTPGTLSIVLATFSPTVLLPVIVTPGTLAISLAEFAPTVSVRAPGTFNPAWAFDDDDIIYMRKY